jgi:hypothetical protein
MTQTVVIHKLSQNVRRVRRNREAFDLLEPFGPTRRRS